MENDMVECKTCLTEIPDGTLRANYPDGSYCVDCAEKTVWHRRFKNMKASEIMKYLGLPPHNPLEGL